MVSNREELAWAAGFVDGEAHFGLATTNSKTQNKHLHIQVCQTEDGPLERLQSVLGCGKIYGPYTQRPTTKYKGNRKPYKQFHIAKFEEVQQVVCMLWPWLSQPKRNQAKAALIGYLAYQGRPKVKRGPAIKTPRIPSCHPDRPFKARNKCNVCYRAELHAERQTNVSK